MPEATAEDLTRMHAAVQFRDRCVKAALDRYRRIGLRPVDTYARAAFDAMEALIRADERRRIGEAVAAKIDEERTVSDGD